MERDNRTNETAHGSASERRATASAGFTSGSRATMTYCHRAEYRLSSAFGGNEEPWCFEALTWTEGAIQGFTIDFEHQRMHYAQGKAVHLEYQKIQVLAYLAAHADHYVTGSEINMEVALNSIDLSKMISSIKSAFLRTLPQEMGRKEATELFNQVIAKSRVNGNMGYQLQLPQNILERSHEKNEVYHPPVPTGPDAEAVAPQETPFVEASQTDDADDVLAITPVTFIRHNWLVFFLLLIGSFMLLTFSHSGRHLIQALYDGSFDLPMSQFRIYVLIGAALPQVCGLLIDTPLALMHYLFAHEIEMTPRRAYRIVKYGDPSGIEVTQGRFNLSSRHILYGLFCNLLGASIILLLRRVMERMPGLLPFLHGNDYPIVCSLSFLVALLIILLMYYYEERRPRPSPGQTDDDKENGFNYLLTRAHVLANIAFLTGTLVFAQLSAFYLFLYHPGKTEALPGLYAAAASLLLACYAYFWFTGLSPFAQKVNATAKRNYVLGPPVVTLGAIFLERQRFSLSLSGIAFMVLAFLVLGHWSLKMVQNRSFFFEKVNFIPAVSFFTIGFLAFLFALFFV